MFILYKPIDGKTQFITDSFIVRYFVAVLSACTAETATYPFDLTKTRLQIQNEIATAKHGFKMENRGVIGTLLHIAKNEGICKLWSGLIVTWQRHLIYSGCRVAFYERLRNLFKDDAGKISIGTASACGLAAGGLAQLIASPSDLVKVKMQAEGRRVLLGKPRQFEGTLSAFKLIYNEGGVLGFWRGAVPNVQRAALVNVGNLAAYDYSKQFIKREFDLPDNALLHGCSAFMASFVAALLSTPSDVIKTRLMNQPTGKDGKGKIYKGMSDCFHESIRNEGPLTLYKGFIPVWMRMGPWALVNWLAFENIMLFIGGKTF